MYTFDLIERTFRGSSKISLASRSLGFSLGSDRRKGLDLRGISVFQSLSFSWLYLRL